MQNKPTQLDVINNEFYNSYAENYDKIPFGETVTKLFLKYLPQKQCQVLEIGSGAGALALWMTHLGHEVICIEPAKKPAILAQKKGLQVYEVRFQDFVSAKKFDAVVAISSLIHIARSEMAEQIRRLSELLMPEGIAILSFLEGDSEGYEDPTKTTKKRYFSKFSQEELSKLLTPYFSIIEMQRIEVKKMNQFFLLMVLKLHYKIKE